MGAIARKKWPVVAALRAAGWTQAAIADKLKVSHQVISETLQQPEVARNVSAILDAAEQQVADVLRAGRSKALERLLTLVESDDEGVALRAAVAVLDRSGVEKGQRLTVSRADEIDPAALRERLRELAAKAEEE